MKLAFTKVEVGKSKPQKTLTQKVFKYYFEELGYSRKDFTEKLGLNHRIFTYGLKVYYTREKIEELRAKKIVKTNIGNRIRTWEDKLSSIEKFYPGFTELFKENVKDSPEKVLEKLQEINDDFYRFKHAMKPIKKYLNQSLNRLGKERIRLVGNGLEFKVKNLLDGLSIPHSCQYPLGKYRFDFKIGESVLLEVDGKQYHRDTGKDSKKEVFANNQGYRVIRISESMINKQPLKTIECLKKLKSEV